MASNKSVALVIGASRGIGRQIAIDLASNGYAGVYLQHPFLPLITNYFPMYSTILTTLLSTQ